MEKILKILAVSDLHVEFKASHWQPPHAVEFDVVVLAGDIHCSVGAAIEWLGELRLHSALADKPVVYVPGNHEFYGGEIGLWPALPQTARAAELGIHLLAPGMVELGGVRFIGAILWTDYALLGDVVMGQIAAERGLTDHRVITWSDGRTRRRFTTADASRLHQRDVAFVEEQLARRFDGPTVVVTHHAPHPDSIVPLYRGSALSPAFASDLSSLILRLAPTVWIHGHDHNSHDYCVGETRIFANQAGYPMRGGGRENLAYDPVATLEVAGALRPMRGSAS